MSVTLLTARRSYVDLSTGTVFASQFEIPNRQWCREDFDWVAAEQGAATVSGFLVREMFSPESYEALASYFQEIAESDRVVPLETVVQSCLNDQFELLKSHSVPIRLMLSGGLDSAYLAVRMKTAGLRFTCSHFTDDEQNPDTIFSKRLCEELDVELDVYMYNELDYIKALPQTVRLLEDPSTTSLMACPLYLTLLKADRNSIVISGEPADILFGGMRSYFNTTDQDRWELRLRGISSGINRTFNIWESLSRSMDIIVLHPFAHSRIVARSLLEDDGGFSDYSNALAGNLEGDGFKQFMKRLALREHSSTLRSIVQRRKIGLPSASYESRRRLIQRYGKSDYECIPRLIFLDFIHQGAGGSKLQQEIDTHIDRLKEAYDHLL